MKEALKDKCTFANTDLGTVIFYSCYISWVLQSVGKITFTFYYYLCTVN